jgi:hypothetical protein
MPTLKLTPLKWFMILAVIAIVLALGLPPDPAAVQKLHTSEAAYRLAITVLLIPYVLIWYTSFYAYNKLQEYTAHLKGAKDGDAFRKITAGMGMLSFTLVVPTIISLILNNVAAHHNSFEAAAVVINNYANLFPGLVAFLMLYNGSHMLLRSTEEGTQKLDLRWHAPWFLLLGVIFSHLTIENYYRSHPYHLALLPLIVTFIVPYLYAWALGLLCANDLHLYARTVLGSLYRRAIKQFASGILVVVVSSIAIQFVNITLMQRLSKSLGALLLIDYGLLIIVAIGLLLIASGTKKLKLIEEI